MIPFAPIIAARSAFKAIKSAPPFVWWIAGAMALVVLFLVWDHFDDKAAVKAVQQEARSEALEKTLTAEQDSAEQRSLDAVKNMMEQQARDAEIAKAAASEAAKPPEQRAKLPPSTVALACQRMRQNYRAAELAAMPAYKEKCQ